MAADFSTSLKYVLENEGGFVNRKQDRGGPTNKGVTMALLEKYRGKSVSLDDMQTLSDIESQGIYEEFFWKPLKVEALNQATATAILDTAVNQGGVAAIKLAQEVLAITADGLMGDNTLTALKVHDVKEFIFDYVGLIQDKYARICTYNASQIIFLEGWLRRSRRLLLLIPGMS